MSDDVVDESMPIAFWAIATIILGGILYSWVISYLIKGIPGIAISMALTSIWMYILSHYRY